MQLFQWTLWDLTFCCIKEINSANYLRLSVKTDPSSSSKSFFIHHLIGYYVYFYDITIGVLYPFSIEIEIEKALIYRKPGGWNESCINIKIERTISIVNRGNANIYQGIPNSITCIVCNIVIYCNQILTWHINLADCLPYRTTYA